MKTKLLAALFLFISIAINAQTPISSTETISVTTEYVDNISMSWIVNGIDNTSPLIVNYNIGTEYRYDFVTIYSIDTNNAETLLVSLSGIQSGSISSVIPSGKVKITFTSDGSVCYQSNSAFYSGINITFSTDTSYPSSSFANSYISGNSIVNGNVGIGVLNPSYKLEVKGTGKFLGNLQLGGSVSFSDNTCFNVTTATVPNLRTPSFLMPQYGIGAPGAGGSADLWLAGNNSIRMFTAGNPTPAVTILQNGAFGIGTTSPQAGLHVTQTYNYNGNYIAAILGSGGSHWTNFGSITGGRIRGSSEGYLVVGSNPNGTGDKNLYLNFDGPANIQMVLGGGKVGIGTDPKNKLDIAAVSGDGIRIGKINDTGTLTVPIGALSAQYNIDFTGYRDIAVDQIGARISALRFNRHEANNALVQKTGLAFYTNQSGLNTGTTDLVERMRISPEGKVGISLTDPTNTLSNTPEDELLTVNGTIHAKEIKVSLDNLADFVFHPSYTLMPLNQVEQFVKTNSHLPEIPSAAEITKNGLSMGEMQNKLLQKIEELTLYVIEQQKQIDELKKNQK